MAGMNEWVINEWNHSINIQLLGVIASKRLSILNLQWEQYPSMSAPTKMQSGQTLWRKKYGDSGFGTGKGQFSFQSQRKAMSKNAQTTAQLHSSHTLVK